MLIIGWAAFGVVLGIPCGEVAHRLARSRGLGRRARAVLAATTGLLFAGMAWRLGGDATLLPDSYLVAVLGILSTVDLLDQRLPRVILLPSYLVLLAAFSADAVLQSRYDHMGRAVAGMAVLLAGYLALALLVGGLGAGDVRLAGLLGLALGWSSWTALLTGTFLGWLTAALARTVLRATRHLDQDDPIPLGPYLTLGTTLALIAGPPISP